MRRQRQKRQATLDALPQKMRSVQRQKIIMVMERLHTMRCASNTITTNHHNHHHLFITCVPDETNQNHVNINVILSINAQKCNGDKKIIQAIHINVNINHQ
mmetsp:Transcript_19893/g.41918  ORF Transcript_19893/g.41918 Transcript_19893/m.41918 type:complete len:101 (-) Transcript_19893:57-359(-)